MRQNDKNQKIEQSQFTFISLKRHHILPALLFIYVIFNVAAIHLGIWNTKPVTSYVAWIASIVPSFNGIAAISNEPEVAAFILATSYGFIPIGYLTIICVAKWRDLDRDRLKLTQPISLCILAMIFILLLTWFFLFDVPDPSFGRTNRFLFTGIKYSHYFLLFYCTVMWLVFSVLLFVITTQLYLGYRKIINKLEVTK